MTSLAHFEALAGSLKLPGEAVIGGKTVASVSGKTFANVTPRNGRVLNHVAQCDAADVDAAVASARTAFETGPWRRLHYRDKKRVLFKLAELMERDAESLAVLESLDVGKPITNALKGDIPGSINTLRYYAEALDKIYGEVGPGTPDRFSFAVHEPLGVVGAIVPWNFPLLMAMWKIAPALAMGNSVILKPAEQSPLTALKIGELALEAGLPAGVLNIVPGFGAEAGKALALHNDVDMIAFTGSGAVGKLLMQYSGQSNLKRVSLELGGKSPHIVFDDCPDLERAATEAAWGIFYNSGQVCTAGSRLLVQAGIADEFFDRLIAVARRIVAGDPLEPATTSGAMVSEEQMQTALRYIETAKQRRRRAGARRQPDARRQRRLLCRADGLRPRYAREYDRSRRSLWSRPRRHPLQ